MKFLLVLITLSFAAPRGFAAPVSSSSLKVKLAQAVLADQEIRDLIDTIARHRSLQCDVPVIDDVVIANAKPEVWNDFELDFGCDGKNGEANVHRLDVKGLVGTVNGKPQSLFTSLNIELSE